MAYVKQEWKNLPNQTTPVNATRMNHIEGGIYDNSVAISNIIESGSNSNGSWIKYSDGTMICYQSFTCNVNYSTKYGSGYYAEITDEIKSFPVSFIETPKVSIGLTTNYGIGCALRDTNTEKCATNIFVYTFASRTDTITLNIIAIGRWK